MEPVELPCSPTLKVRLVRYAHHEGVQYVLYTLHMRRVASLYGFKGVVYTCIAITTVEKRALLLVLVKLATPLHA